MMLDRICRTSKRDPYDWWGETDEWLFQRLQVERKGVALHVPRSREIVASIERELKKREETWTR